MRTIVYVDGYNLFYSLLTKSPYKWLDLHALFNTQIIHPIAPQSELVKIKYFTAPALGSMSKDPKVEQRQARYHRALKASGKVEIIKGYHQKAITTGYPVERVEGIERLKVHVMEEKQTDVNIGLHMYRDAVKNECEQIVLVSNDADLEPALVMIKQDMPNIQIGLVLPRKSNNLKSRFSNKLDRHTDWTRKHINDQELEKSLFPLRLLDHRNKTIRCPDEWLAMKNT